MKRSLFSALCCLALAASSASAVTPATPTISGDYLEVRSCDVYTGPCFANAEMGLTGKEGILVWTVRQGGWEGSELKGLTVMAVVRTDSTMGDQRYNPSSGDAVLIVDARATSRQRQALTSFARSMAGSLIREVVAVKDVPMHVALATCDHSGCATVKAGNLVEISTRCLGDKDHLCGNEEAFYPPLTEVTNAYAAYTELASFKGRELNVTWQATGQRSAFLGAFSR